MNVKVMADWILCLLLLNQQLTFANSLETEHFHIHAILIRYQMTRTISYEVSNHLFKLNFLKNIK